MTRIVNLRAIAAGALFSAAASLAGATGFNSGSTGADGPFSPTANTTVTLPPSGIFNYTTIDIPAGVTVTFARNPTNTPVVLLATGNVNIAGAIDVSGGVSLTSGFGTTGDRSLPGLGGPGGYDGGRGGAPEVNRRAGNGLGPGAGGGGDAVATCCSAGPQGGGGGGYGLAGAANLWGVTAGNTGLGGGVYGSNLLTPLVGGSGGGGGAGAAALDGFYGTGGGGGGGAILIAVSGTVTLTGSILANGGNSGNYLNTGIATQTSATGGAGSGGAIRIVASNFTGSGTLSVNGGTKGTNGFSSSFAGGNGGRGRTSTEIVTTGTLALAGLPALAITSVAGVAAPAAPSGVGDVVLAAGTANPATVVFATTGIPVGNTVSLTLTPQRGAATTVTSAPLAGTVGAASASASIDIPSGPSTLIARTSYTITVAMGESLSRFANNERVERIEISATYGGPSQAKLITVSGKVFDAPAEAMRIVALGR